MRKQILSYIGKGCSLKMSSSVADLTQKCYPCRTAQLLGVGRMVTGGLSILLMIIAIAIVQGTSTTLAFSDVVTLLSSGVWCGAFVRFLYPCQEILKHG